MGEKFYTYLWLREDGSPYYAGKGCERRAYRKHRIGNPPPDDRIILQYHPSEKEAFEAEIFLIEYFGRKNLGNGCLWNLTDGGEGASGFVRSEEAKAKYKGRKLPPEVVAKIAQFHRGRKRPKETGKRIREAKTKYTSCRCCATKLSAKQCNTKCPECGERNLRPLGPLNQGGIKYYSCRCCSYRLTGRQLCRKCPECGERNKTKLGPKNQVIRSPESIAKQSEKMKGRKRSAESCAKQSAAMTGRTHSEKSKELMRLVQKDAWTPARRENQSERQKGKPRTTETKDKMSSSKTKYYTCRGCSTKITGRQRVLGCPECKEVNSIALGPKNQIVRSPEYRAKQSAAQKSRCARKRSSSLPPSA